MEDTRAYWIATLLRIAGPVFEAMAADRLRELMPVEYAGDADQGLERAKFTHLEALGRSLSGIGPWLNLAAGSAGEAAERDRLADLVCAALTRAVDRGSRDYLDFAVGDQTMVDGAFLAQ